jgi:hypothetical protein
MSTKVDDVPGEKDDGQLANTIVEIPFLGREELSSVLECDN